MKNVPYFAGNSSFTQFDKDAQDAFIWHRDISQDGSKVEIKFSDYDPYTKQTDNFIVKGEIVAYSKKLKIVKIKTTENKLQWFDYNNKNFVNPEPEQIFYLKNKNISPNIDTVNILVSFFNIAVSLIQGKKFDFVFKKYSAFEYSNEIAGFKILLNYNNGSIEMSLIAPDNILATIELGIYEDKKRNGYISFIGVSQKLIDIIFTKYRKFLYQTDIIAEW